jgi:hypothetical protein
LFEKLGEAKKSIDKAKPLPERPSKSNGNANNKEKYESLRDKYKNAKFGSFP